MKYLNRNLVELGEQHWGPDPTAGKTSAGDLWVGGRWDHHFSLAGRPYFQLILPSYYSWIINSSPTSFSGCLGEASSEQGDRLCHQNCNRTQVSSTLKLEWQLINFNMLVLWISHLHGTFLFSIQHKWVPGKVHACLSINFRELHSSVSKVGKAVDRNFVADFDSTAREEVCIASLIWSNI